MTDDALRETAHNLPSFTGGDLANEALERASTIPSDWYVHPAFHAFDRAAVMERSWQYAGHLSRIPEPGDFLTETIAGNPVLVVRADDGDVRAFYNVCRHRGGPLAMEPCGHSSMLQCKYHGWTYRLDGSLRGVPRFDRTDLFDKRDYGLRSIDVDVWSGLVFVRLEPGCAPSLSDLTAGINERIAPIDLSSKQFHSRTIDTVACNWKVYVDNYLEGYHIPLVHPELCKLIDVRSYQTECSTWYSLQHSPFRGGENLYGDSDGRAFYYFVYPNIMLNIMPGRLQVNRIVERTAEECDVIFDYFYDDLSSELTLEMIRQDHEFADLVQQEDIEICEYVQRGLGSKAYDRGRFSVDAEAGVHHFQSLLRTTFSKWSTD